MVTRDDARNTVELPDSYVIKPMFRYFVRRFDKNGSNPLPEDFEFNSATNTWWLSVEELRAMIETL